MTFITGMFYGMCVLFMTIRHTNIITKTICDGPDTYIWEFNANSYIPRVFIMLVLMGCIPLYAFVCLTFINNIMIIIY
jgi:hypothetical protein